MLKKSNSIISLFELGSLFSSKIRNDFLFLITLSILTSIFDVLSVASIIPFLGTLPGISSGDQNAYPLLNSLNLGSNPIITSVIILSVVVFIASFTRIYTIFYSYQISSKFAHIISKEIFKARFGTSFEHLIRTDIKISTAELVLYITKTVDSLMHFSKLITSLLISALISIFLITTKPFISLSTLLLIGSIYILLGMDSRKRMNNLSKTIARYTENQIQIIQEIYGMSRNIYLDDSFSTISKDYYKFDLKNKKLYALSEFLGSYPRFVVEAFAIIIVALLTVILILLNKSSENNIIPYIGAFAFASQRLLPAIQAIYSNWAGIKANDEFVKNIIKTLRNKNNPTQYILSSVDKKISHISFKNLSFNYKSTKKTKFIIDNFNYQFNSGDRIAIIGKTGSGKSTLLDIIACLRNPTNGSLIFRDNNDKLILENNIKDEKNKSTKIIPNCALVPQFSYVINSSIEENICLSSQNDEIDFERLKYAADISNLSDFINKNHEGFSFNPTQNGYSLSGGQVQRLAIARAIYKMSPLLLMDESTSALDKQTSIQIIDNIFKQKHIDFVFAITHSSYYLDKFTHIVEFKSNGQIDVSRN